MAENTIEHKASVETGKYTPLQLTIYQGATKMEKYYNNLASVDGYQGGEFKKSTIMIVIRLMYLSLKYL